MHTQLIPDRTAKIFPAIDDLPMGKWKKFCLSHSPSKKVFKVCNVLLSHKKEVRKSPSLQKKLHYFERKNRGVLASRSLKTREKIEQFIKQNVQKKHVRTSPSKLIRYGAYSSGIALFYMLSIPVELLTVLPNLYWSRKDPKISNIQKELHKYAGKKRSMDLITHWFIDEILPSMLASLNEDGEDLLLDLLSAKELTPYLHDILNGANVRLKKDRGAFFKKWAKYSRAYHRVSSHEYKKGKCYGFSGRIFNEFTFWIDLKGDTRFQIEKNPTKINGLGMSKMLLHLVDYLRYLRDERQQSQFGSSKYTEKHCLELRVNKSTYRKRRARLNKRILSS